jgi:hypothetical protein
MVSIDLVEGPKSISLWRRKVNGKQVLLIGEDHLTRYGVPKSLLEIIGNPDPEFFGRPHPHIEGRLSGEAYIRKKLEEDKDMKVFAELPTTVPGNARHPSSLVRLQFLKQNGGLPNSDRDRIINIDYRPELFQGLKTKIEEKRRRTISDEEAYDAIRANLHLIHGQPQEPHVERGIQRYQSLPFRVSKHVILNPVMDDLMVKKMRENPNEDLIFLTGDGHSRNVVEDYLTKEGATDFEHQYTHRIPDGDMAETALPITRF